MKGRKSGKAARMIATQAFRAAGLTQRETAKRLGVNEVTLWRDQKEIAREVPQALAVIRSQISEKIPIPDRVSRLRGLMDQEEQAMAALKTVQYVNQLDGICVEEQREEKQQPAPLFMLPPGTRIAIGAITPGEDKAKPQSSLSVRGEDKTTTPLVHSVEKEKTKDG